MGGKGSGGRRIGSGRKPKDRGFRALDGNASHRGRVLPHPRATAAAPTPPPADEFATDADQFSAPDELTVDERNVWDRLAPHAIAAGTLTKATVLAFGLLCQNIVLERALRLVDSGSARHRGLMMRLDAQLDRFSLTGRGKPSTADTQPDVDPMEAKYFGQRA